MHAKIEVDDDDVGVAENDYVSLPINGNQTGGGRIEPIRGLRNCHH